MRILVFILTSILTTTCVSSQLNADKGNIKKLIQAGKDVFIENVTFTDAVDFTEMFPANPVGEGLYQVRIASSVTFKNCTFEDDVIAFKIDPEGNRTFTAFQSNLSFIGCSFKGKAQFRACSVLGRAVFTASFFEMEANFEECSFAQHAYYNRCVFHEELRFQNAFFMQRTTFMDAGFDVNASFQGSTFNSTAQFSNTKFYGYADFSMVNWNGNCFFNYAEIVERSVFNNSFYAQSANFISVTFGSAEIVKCRFFGDVSFSKSSIQTQLKLDQSFFLLGKPDLGFFDQDKLTLTGID
jgi:hypothetical protein